MCGLETLCCVSTCIPTDRHPAYEEVLNKAVVPRQHGGHYVMACKAEGADGLPEETKVRSPPL